ncbi:SusC/RagA family TonB-linked outer membrane protein [Mucilaginibacter lacusdianchii]|uniref:SusC/RagA family TonB-linked outer membrane protein n=1 Tax=Mucilaginibacter lacusdianchii TaxID=2684211 RepID=UPI00131C53B5|nr:SusC/RagA family TonB-linked outer membrane protein [Mucilaginibacter sp. JXJ CY 39]
MKKVLLNFLWVLLLLSTQVYAQTRTVTGKVTGKDDGLGLPGVSVMVQGSKSGTQTGPDGSYSIKIASGQVLTFSFVGFTSQSITPTGDRVDVVMSGTASTLNDVVVVGYGTQVRRDVVGSIGTVKGTDIAQQPVQNIQQALGGRVAGAQVNIPTGVLNSTPVIRIRGTNSINGSSQPLYVIDGVPSFSGNQNGGTAAAGDALANINPEDIESIDVGKDAAATAIYGSRAANGVIFVTTKKGKKGKTVVTLDSWIGMNKPYRLPKLLNAADYTIIKNEGLVNAGTYRRTGATNDLYYENTLDANGNIVNTNWFDYIYRTATSYNSTMSLSGANENTSYYLSANWSKQEGLIQKNGFERKQMLANFDHKASKIITVGGKLSYSNSLNTAATSSGSQEGEAFGITGLGRIGLVLPPNISPYNANGTYNINGNTLGLGANKGLGIGYYNIVPLLDLNRSSNEINQVSSNLYVQIKPLSWVTFKSQYGIDYLYRNIDTYQNPIQGDGNPTASATGTFYKNQRWVWDNTLQFDRTFAAKHSVSLLLGNEQQRTASRGFGINRTVISDPAFDVVQAGYATNVPSGMAYSEDYLVSFFGRLNYDFDKKYYISGTLRRDEFSAFGANNKAGYFPGGAVAYEIAREKFWNSINADKIFSSFRLRASYGRVGNANNIGAYDSYGLYATGLYNTAGSLYFNQTGNPNLQWETISKLDLGANFGVLNDRVTAEVTYYKSNITDLILPVETAPSAGLPSRPVINIGSMFNKGVEIGLNAEAIRSKDFSWNSSFNISFNRNQLVSLAEGQTRITSTTSGSETASISEVGHSIGSLYIVRTAGVDPASGRRIFLNAAGREVLYSHVPATGRFQWEYTDGTRAPAITQSADAVNYKQTAPKAFGGFSNTFRYKSFDLNVLLTYQLGGYTYYGTNAGLHDQRFWNNNVDILNRWTTPGQVTNIPRVVANDNVSNGSTLPMSANVFKSDFLKVKSFNFGYALPKPLLSKVGLSNLRFYVSGYNLFVFTKYPGSDPEVSSNGAGSAGNTTQGIDRNSAANQRTLTAGFTAKF